MRAEAQQVSGQGKHIFNVYKYVKEVAGAQAADPFGEVSGVYSKSLKTK